MKIITRKEAIASGLRFYFTGSMCGNGHTAEKSVIGWKCQECKRNDEQRWRDANPSKARDIQARFKANNPARAAQIKKNYKERNKEKIADSQREYTEKNRVRIAARLREYWKLNRSRISARMREYNRANRGLIAALANKYRASKVSATPSWADLKVIREIYEGTSKNGMEVDHIIPLQGKIVCGLHVENNLQIVPRSENRRKSHKFNPLDFEVILLRVE